MSASINRENIELYAAAATARARVIESCCLGEKSLRCLPLALPSSGNPLNGFVSPCQLLAELARREPRRSSSAGTSFPHQQARAGLFATQRDAT